VDRQDDDFFICYTEIDSVGKLRQHGSPHFTIRSLERQRIGDDACDEGVDGSTELPTEPFASRLVPPAHVQRVIFGLRPENNPPSHG